MKSRFFISNQSDLATIDIEGEIGSYIDWDEMEVNTSNTPKSIKKQLKAISEIRARKIIININSLGGSLFDAISIYDMLREHPAEKVVNIYGMTASAATIVAMAGDTVRMSDNALLLVHRSSMVAIGNANDMQMALDDLKTYDERIANIYSKRTGRSIESHLDQMNANNGVGEWLTPEEAKEAGYIDEIFMTEQKRVAASLSELQAAQLPIPKQMEEKQMDEVKNMITALKDWLAETFGTKPEKAAFDVKVTEIETKLRELAVDLETANANVADIDTLTAERDQITAERDTLQARVTELESENEALKATGTGVTNEKDPDVEGTKGKEHPFDGAAKLMKKNFPL